uniref:sulfotransferase n=1 Tax=Synechococcus sp. UW106 TaxID=368495 RepID=UPI0014822D50|nr:sulfotransferase [Synechococcus sp. UW106]
MASIQELCDCAEARPDDLEIQLLLLKHWKKLKLRLNVIESLQQIVNLDPHRVTERLQLGRFQELRGSTGSADQQFDNCIDLLDKAANFNHALIGEFLGTAQCGHDLNKNNLRLQSLLKAINDFEPRSNAEIKVRSLSQARMHFVLRQRQKFLDSINCIKNDWAADPVKKQLESLAKRWQDDNFSALEAPKIFVIGLSRTGTTSMHDALKICGYQSLHWVNPLTGCLPDETDIGLYDAAGDINISSRFESLATRYPNARFILTQRSIQKWLRSIKDHYSNYHGINHPSELLIPSLCSPYTGQSGIIHASLYAHHSTWVDVFQAYENRVETFFADQPERLLKIDITLGCGWHHLTSFLGIPEPDKAFPHTNSSPRHHLKAGFSSTSTKTKVSDNNPNYLFPLDIVAKLASAKIALEGGEIVEARRLYELILVEKSDNCAALVGLAWCEHKDGNWIKAAELFQKARLLEPEHQDALNWLEHELSCQLRGARAALEGGEIVEARRLYELILVEKSDNCAALVGLAWCEHKDGNWIKAAELFQKARLLEPEHQDALNWLRSEMTCFLRAERLGDVAKAVKQLTYLDPQLKSYVDVTTNIADGTHNHLNYDYVFIITYGRSGSTLLQGVLNSINGLLVRGENYNSFFSLYEFVRNMEIAQDYGPGWESFFPSGPWFGACLMSRKLIMQILRDAARKILLADLLDDTAVTAIGFKEIRYPEIGDDLPGYLHFLEELFPKSAFIINTRDHAATAESAWWADQSSDEVRLVLNQTESYFKNFAVSRNNCFEISYSDVVDRGIRLRELFDFLGATFDPIRLDKVFAVRHSYQPKIKTVCKTSPTSSTDVNHKSSIGILASLDALKQHPHDTNLLFKLVSGLAAWDRFAEAEEYVQRIAAINDIQGALARVHLLECMNSWDDAIKLLAELHSASPKNKAVLNRYYHSLLRVNDFEEANRTLSKLKVLEPSKNHDLLSSTLLHQKEGSVDSLAFLFNRFQENSGEISWKRRILFLCFNSLTRDASNAFSPLANDILDYVLAEAVDDSQCIFLAIKIAVALGRDHDAFTLLESSLATIDDHHKFKLISWSAYCKGDIEEARRNFDIMIKNQPIPQVRSIYEGELARIDNREMQVDANKIRLATVIKNELWRLPWFLDYYRSIGIDEFIFVDNDSNDGSLDYLLQQPDVLVFHTKTPYKIGRSGVVWLNHIFSLFDRGWNIYVDVDEALVFHDIEIHGIRGLTSYMDRHGHDVAAGQMIDMFKVDSSESTKFGNGAEDFIASYPLFDKTYVRWPVIDFPYFRAVGGIRQAVGVGEISTKTPVMKAGRNIKLLLSSHTVTPGYISDVDLGLLHFKLAGDFRNDFAEVINSNGRIRDCQNRYKKYKDYFDDWSARVQDLDWSKIATYQTSKSLVQHGVISSLPSSFV